MLKAEGKREALRELREWQDEMEEKAQFNKGHISGKTQTVGEFLSLYVETLAGSQSLEKTTIYGYRKIVKQIDTVFYGIPYDELDYEQVQQWVNESLTVYSPNSVKKALNLLKAACRDAVLRRAIPYSPLEAVRSPKLKQHEPNALDAPTRQRLLSYLDIADNTPVTVAIRLALTTGMRAGELCGLQWRNVDFDADVLHVRTAVGRDGGKLYLKEPKTRSSRRDIPLTPEISAILHQRREGMFNDCMKAGVSFNANMYVLGTIEGAYMSPHTLWREWKAIAKSLGLIGTEGVVPTFHDLRHTFATAAIASGADVKSVASIMGHANAAMTLNVYATADPEAKRRTMGAVSAAIIDTPRDSAILAIGKPKKSA